MTEIGDLLALIHDSDALVRSFEGEFRDWAQPSPSRAVVVDPAGVMRWEGIGPFPRTAVTRRRIWFQQRHLLRVELLRNEELIRLGVHLDDKWWRWDRTHGIDHGSAKAADGPADLPPLLEPLFLTPERLITRVRFELIGEATRAGRPVLVARGRPRQPERSTEGIVFELDFDAENGTMLRHATIDNGHCVQVMEAVTVRFDRPIDPGRFLFDPPTH